VLLRHDLAHRDALLDLEHGQFLLVLERLRIALLARLAVQRQEALELHDAAGGAEHVRPDAGRVRGTLRTQLEVDGRGVEHRRRHLRRHEALPYQLVELELIGRQILAHELRTPRGVRGADALVRVLRVRLLGAAVQLQPRRQVVGAEQRAQVVLRRRRRALGDARRVGPHVRDETDRALGAEVDALVQVLRQAHRALRAVAELLRALLLQRRGGERRLWILAPLAPLHVGDREDVAPLEIRQDRVGLRLIRDLGLLPIDVMELGRELLAGLVERRRDRPVLDRQERADLALALDDQAQRDRLHAAGGQPLLDRLPEHRAGLVADQAVQDATGLLGVDLLHVDLAGLRHRPGDALPW
jgi:hypothetical protein